MTSGRYIPYHPDIYALFQDAMARDRQQFIEDWLVTWQYQDKRERRKVRYPGDYNQDFHAYKDPSELLQWFNWLCSQPKPDYFNDEVVVPLVKKSRAFDERIANICHFSYDWEQYEQFIGRNNALDYLLSNLYPHPADSASPRILDFGAGYGRQANLWTQMQPNVVYVGMDAIPKSYCLQHLYYAHSDKLVYDYIINGPDDKPNFSMPGIYHLPSWRRDLIPDNSFDKILAIQVLQEINGRLVKEMIRTFHRILKPSGMLFIRDSDVAWRPAHRLNLNAVLEQEGFTLEYRAHVEDKKDILGVPRIWRKTNPDIAKQQRISLAQRFYEAKIDFDAMTRGKIKQMIKSIFASSKSSR